MLVALPSPTYRLHSSKARPPQKFGHRDLLYEEYYSPRKIYLMIHYYIYYINPKTNELIAFNDESREVMPLERVGQVLLTALPENKPMAPARKTLKNSKRPKVGKPKSAASKFAGTDEATISKIKEMYEDGSTMKGIKEATGL